MDFQLNSGKPWIREIRDSRMRGGAHTSWLLQQSRLVHSLINWDNLHRENKLNLPRQLIVKLVQEKAPVSDQEGPDKISRGRTCMSRRVREWLIATNTI